jgi:hypothetical protein
MVEVVPCPYGEGYTKPYCGIVSGDIVKMYSSPGCTITTSTVQDCSNTQKCVGITDPLQTGAAPSCVSKCQGVTCGSGVGQCPDKYSYPIPGVCEAATGLCSISTKPTDCVGHEVTNLCILSWNGNTPNMKTCSDKNYGVCTQDGKSAISKQSCNPTNGNCEPEKTMNEICSARPPCQPNPAQTSKTCYSLGGTSYTQTCDNSCVSGVTKTCSITCPNPCNGWSATYTEKTCPNGDVVSAADTCSSSTGKITQGNPTCSAIQNEVCGNGKCNSVVGETTSTCPVDCPDVCASSSCGDNVCKAVCGETSATCCGDCGGCGPDIRCGDGICSAPTETATSCPSDCACVSASCGDGTCDSSCGETSDTCANDCYVPVCGDGRCDPSEEGVCTIDCDPCTINSCAPGCNMESALCGDICGDGICAESEKGTCIPDCGCLNDCPKEFCGDGTCQAYEKKGPGTDPAICVPDCGVKTCQDDPSMDICKKDCSKTPDLPECKKQFDLLKWVREHPGESTGIAIGALALVGAGGYFMFKGQGKPSKRRHRR